MIQIPQTRKYVNKKTNSTGTSSKAKTCNIKGCSSPAVRSLSRPAYEAYMKDAKLELKSQKERKITPCDQHYKMMKKKKKKDDKIKKVKFNTGSASKVGKYKHY